ncbi:MAG: outer membrane biosynthesis protein TonB [Verrucomicrobiales bacterium]
MTVDSQRPFLNSNRLVVSSIAVSLAVHLALVPPVAQWLEKSREVPEDEAAPMRSEVVLPMADWVMMEASSLPQEPADEEEPDAAAEEKELGYVRTTANQASLTSPDSPDFVSDRNTRVSADELGSGNEALPTVNGEDEDTNEFEDRRYRDGALMDESPSPEQQLATPGSVAAISSDRPPVEAQPVPASATNIIGQPLPENLNAIPLPRPNPTLNEEPSESDDEGLAETREPVEEEMPLEPQVAVANVPPGAPTAPIPAAPSTLPVPSRNEEAFQSETRRAKMDGGAKRKGYAAYDAENSPIGRYRKELSAAIERAWQMRMLASRDFMDFNTKIRVEFSVNRWGKIKNLRVPKRANNAVLTNETLSAIIEAKIPEMPAAVQEELDGGDLPCFYNFRIH